MSIDPPIKPFDGPGLCYCGEYGGGVHTKSARCDASNRPTRDQMIRAEEAAGGDYESGGDNADSVREMYRDEQDGEPSGLICPRHEDSSAESCAEGGCATALLTLAAPRMRSLLQLLVENYDQRVGIGSQQGITEELVDRLQQLTAEYESIIRTARAIAYECALSAKEPSNV